MKHSNYEGSVLEKQWLQEMRPNKKQKANAGLHNDDDDDDEEEHEVVDPELGFEWVHGSDESSQGDSGRDTGFDQFVAMVLKA